jgi:hypothetical protein
VESYSLAAPPHAFSPSEYIEGVMEINREVPPDDLPSLTLLCALNEGETVPDEVLVQYWRVRRLTSRMGHCGPLSVESLMCVGLNAGLGYLKPADIVAESFTDKVRRGKVKAGDKIKVKWRDNFIDATFLLVRADGEVECQTDERKRPIAVPANDAKAIHEHELEEVA